MRLDTSSSYGWNNVRRRDFVRVPQSRRMRWWVLLALVFSILVHVGLFLYFGDIRLTMFSSKAQPTASRPIPVNRVELDPMVLDQQQDVSNQQSDKAVDLSQLEQEALPDETLDEDIDLIELQEMIPDEREIEFSPKFAQPMNIAPEMSEATAAATLAASMDAIEAVSVADKQDAMNSLSSQLDNAPIASERQMKIDMAAQDSAMSDQKDLIDKIRNAADKQGNGDALDGFATLDQLLDVPGGRLTDASKPIYMPTDLLFEFNAFELRDTAKTSLMMLGVLIDRNPDTVFVIEGHTDTIGTHESNLELSRKRAVAVRDWLMEALLIKQDRIKVSALGETRPLVSPTGTADEQQPNRRVEIRTVKKGSAAAVTTPTEPEPAPIPVRRAVPVEEGSMPVRRAIPVPE